MDKELLRFINGEINVLQLNMTLVREPTLPNGFTHIEARPSSEQGRDMLLLNSWDASNRPKSDTPKHTGGKKPYIILMVDEVEKLRAQGVVNVEELIGYLVCLGRYVEWNTGRLIHRREKTSLQYKDLQSMFPCGNRKLNRILAEMKEYDLLFKTTEGYFISYRFIKKGKAKTTQGGQ